MSACELPAPGSCGPLSSPLSASCWPVAAVEFDEARARRRDSVDLVAEGLHQAGDLRFDLFQRAHDLANSLTRNVLEIAGLIDVRHRVGDAVLGFTRERAAGFFDLFDRIENRVRCFCRRADDGVKLIRGGRQMLVLDFVGAQRRDLQFGVADEPRQPFQLGEEAELRRRHVAAQRGDDALDDRLDLGAVDLPVLGCRHCLTGQRPLCGRSTAIRHGAHPQKSPMTLAIFCLRVAALNGLTM